MPVQTQIMSIALAKGLDTKTDPKQVIPASLTVLENGVFTTPDRISKRNGYVPLAITNGPTHGLNIGTFQGGLISLDANKTYNYSNTEDSWYPNSNKETVSVTQQAGFTPGLLSTNAGAFMPVNAFNTDGVQMISWLVSNGTNIATQYSLIDPTTGVAYVIGVDAYPFNNTYKSLWQYCFNVGTNFVIIFYAADVDDIYYVVINPVTGQPGTPVLLLTHVVSQNIDIVFDYATTKAYLSTIMGVSPTLSTVEIDISTTTLTVLNTVSTGATTAPVVNLSYDFTNNYVWLFYYDGTDEWYTIYNSSLTATILAPTMIDSNATLTNATACTLNGVGYYFYTTDVGNFPWQNNNRIAICQVAGTSTSSVVMCNGVWGSRPFILTNPGDGNPYIHIIVNFNSLLQNTYFVIRYFPLETVQQWEVVAKMADGTAVYDARIGREIGEIISTLYFPYVTSDSQVVVPLLQEQDEVLLDGVPSFTQGVFTSTLNFFNQVEKNEIAYSTYLSGGLLSLFDGAYTYENNFCIFPEGIVATVNVGSGDMLPGTYSYEVTYEFIDASGQLYRSAPSAPLEVTITTDDGPSSVSIQVPYIFLTNKVATNINLVVWRTTANETTYFRLPITAANSIAGIFQDAVIADNNVDTLIEGNTQLYTTGGEVPNMQPVAGDLIIAYKNRLILVSSEDPYNWWYSKQVIQGFPVEFSNLFVSTIDQQGGPITALAYMDAELIFFKENVIFYVTGTGPAPNGSSNDFTYPQIITTDVGCTEAASVVLTPMGIMFKSAKGIFLLDRSLSTTYIGAPVEEFNSIGITSAQLIPNTTQVRFSLADGTALVFDYFVQQWGQFTNINAIDTTLYQSVYTTLNSSALVQQETEGVFTDNGTPIPLLLTLGKILTAQVQGFERVKQLMILGQALSPTNLSISFNYDYSIIPNQTTMIPVTAPAMPMQYRIFLNQQKCEDLQITISDSPQIPYGEGINLSNLALEVGVKKGPYKVPAAITYA